MTLSSETTRAEAVGDASTVEFFFNFKTLSTAHVKVFLDSVEQGSGFSVALNEDQESAPGGSVTFLDPPALDVAIRVQRSMPRTQTTDFSPFAAVRAATLEASLDAVVMQVQEVEQSIADTGAAGLAAAAAVAADLADLEVFVTSETAQGAAVVAQASASSASASAAAAAASETALAESARLASIARIASQIAPIPVTGASQARAIALRCILYNRAYSTAGIRMWRSGGYGGWYFGELWYWMRQAPGLFDATELRRVIDHWATGYRSVQHDLPMFMSEADSFGYAEGSVRFPYDVPALFALLVAYAIERGDTTVWAAHGATALDCLTKYPIDVNGLLTIPDSTTALGIGFEDAESFEGAATAATGLFALAYQQLATFADPTLQATADAFVTALRTMRRSDGYYDAAGNESQASVLATALIVGHGLCSADEALQTGNRLADDYLAGIITQRGALRFLPSPLYWSTSINAQGSFQNGGFINGPWVWWAAKAMILGGRPNEAKALMTDYVREFLRQNLGLPGRAPFEWFNEAVNLFGYDYYNTGGCALAGVVDPPPDDITVVLPGAASSAVVVPVHAHQTQGIEILAPAAATATVAVSAAPRTHLFWDQIGTGYGTAVEMARLSLAATTSRQLSRFIKPGSLYGGYLKAAITSGSSTSPITVRLMQRPVAVPKMFSHLTSLSDTFTTDSIASYLLSNPTYWSVTGGLLQKGQGNSGQVDMALYPIVWKDGTIEVDTRSSWASYNPGLVVRFLDDLNYIWVRILPGSPCQVVEVINGVSTVLATTGDNAVLNTWIHLKIVLAGTAMTVTSGATSTGYTVTNVTAGLSGLVHYGLFTGVAIQGEWDNLSIVPASGQRDWITDSELIYTRTGTWTKSGGRLRTVDTGAVSSAIHPDFSVGSIGVRATFTSADWANKKAGLCVLGTTSATCIYAVLDGTTVKAYGRVAGVDTLLGTGTLSAALTNGVDVTMHLRAVKAANGLTIVVKVGSQVFKLGRAGLATGSAGAFVTTSNSSAAEVSYASMLIHSYAANLLQPVPPGYVLDAGDIQSAWITDDVCNGAVDETVVLRDIYGTPIQTVTGADDVVVVY